MLKFVYVADLILTVGLGLIIGLFAWLVGGFVYVLFCQPLS